MSLLIKGAQIVSSEGISPGDVLICDGKIERIGTLSNNLAEKVIEATHLHLIPGVLDPQVHFREPGMVWKEGLETGSMAAVAGGVTSFFEMPNTRPATISRDAIQDKKNLAAQKSLANFNFFIGATENNLTELNETPNVCGIKIFMGSSTGDLLVSDPKVLDSIFKNGRRLIAVHAEDEETIRKNQEKYRGATDPYTHNQIRTPEAALKATQLAVQLSRKYQRRLHILHLSTEEETQFLSEFKDPAYISVEVCPQHFLLQAPEIYNKLGTYAQMNPPLREQRHCEALWRSLKSGLIDCIATDHAPHTREEKEQPYGKAPAGLTGVETSLPLMLQQVHLGRCTLQEVVLWMCETPVRLYGVQNKGHIKEGFDADCVLVDMKRQKTIENGKLFTKPNWSPYHGMEITGWPVMTLVGGHPVFCDGDINTDQKGTEIQIDPSWEKK